MTWCPSCTCRASAAARTSCTAPWSRSSASPIGSRTWSSPPTSSYRRRRPRAGPQGTRSASSSSAARPTSSRFAGGVPDPALKQGKQHLLCYLGVMGPQDGVDYALESLAALRDMRPDDWHAVFVGSGDCFERDARARKPAGASTTVSLHRADPGRATAAPTSSTADVALSPDPAQPAQRRLDDEQDPRVHGGRPADRLVRPAGGARLGRRRGPLRRRNDTDAFAAATSALLDDPAERRAARADRPGVASPARSAGTTRRCSCSRLRTGDRRRG